MTIRCRLLPIHRSAASRNSAGVASLFLEPYGAKYCLLVSNSDRLTPQIMSPAGRSFSVWMRLITTPEPAETGSTAIPVSLLKAAKTNLCRVSSLDEYTTIFCCAIVPVLAQMAPKVSRSATPSEVEAKAFTMPLLATSHDRTYHCPQWVPLTTMQNPAAVVTSENRTNGCDRGSRAARNQTRSTPPQPAVGDPGPAFFLHMAPHTSVEQLQPPSLIGGSSDAP